MVDIARQAVESEAQGITPRVVSLGTTAALYHYTGWPALDFYNHDEVEIENFFSALGPRLIVLPERDMSIQWANTPAADRWKWMQSRYRLERQGEAGEYVVYLVEPGE